MRCTGFIYLFIYLFIYVFILTQSDPQKWKILDIATANVVTVLYMVIAVWFDSIFRDLEWC